MPRLKLVHLFSLRLAWVLAAESQLTAESDLRSALVFPSRKALVKSCGVFLWMELRIPLALVSARIPPGVSVLPMELATAIVVSSLSMLFCDAYVEWVSVSAGEFS